MAIGMLLFSFLQGEEEVKIHVTGSVCESKSEAAQVGSVPSTITLQSFTAAAQAHKHQLTSVISFAELWRAEGLPGHMEIPQQPPLLQHHLDYY